MLSLDDVEIQTEDIPGWTVTTEGQMTIALDINLSEELKQEGIAREFINKIQNLRKENGFEVTDRIKLRIAKHEAYNVAVENHKEYICAQTLADELELADSVDSARSKEVEIDKEVQAQIVIEKLG
jgi:isoleucyl-tRNA synthetase